MLTTNLLGVALFAAIVVWMIDPHQPFELPATFHDPKTLPVRMPLFPGCNTSDC